jgi:hypothetical protein
VCVEFVSSIAGKGEVVSSANEPVPGQQTPPPYQPVPPYPPQMPHQQPPPPKKRRNFLRLGCGAILALLACVVLGSVLLNRGGGDQAGPTAVAGNTGGGTAVGAGNSAGGSAPTGTSAGARPVATVQAFKKGETATLDGQKVTLNEATRNGAVYVADLTVENTGTKQINVSSLVSFEARDALGNKGSFKLTESKGLDGTVDPGGKLRGTIGYEFAADAKGVKLYYSSAVFTGQPTVFALDDAAVAQPFPPHPIAAEAKPLDTKVTYKAGDAVKVGDLVMKLEKVTAQGTLITADLVAYNAGGKAVSLSSLASFTGQDSTGKKGDFKLPDKASFDGTLLPGDSLRGQVRLEFDAGSTGHTLTYRSSVFGGQAIKWALD